MFSYSSHTRMISAILAFQMYNWDSIDNYSTKRVEWVVFQSFDIFSVMVHAIETTNIPT